MNNSMRVEMYKDGTIVVEIIIQVILETQLMLEIHTFPHQIGQDNRLPMVGGVEWAIHQENSITDEVFEVLK